MKPEDILKALELTSGEIKVYMALLYLGKSTAGPITKESRVSPSKIYNILDRLAEKGIVSYIIEGKIKKYSVLPPKHLLDFIEQKRASLNEELDEQEEKLKTALPTLQQRYKAKKEPQSAEIYEGIRGIKTFFDMALEECSRGDIVKVVGYPAIASKTLNAYFKEYNKKRAKLGIVGKIVFDYEAWFGKKREKRTLVKYRYLPKSIKTPAFIAIFKDRVGTMVFSEKQKLCFMIKNQEVADSYDQYFELMWKTAKPV